MPRLAVLGQPVGHSRSPAMQNAALAELGLAPQWTYEAIEVAPPDFEALVRELPGDGFAGVNVTVPHKLAALAIADAASEAARAIGAANMLSFAPGGVEAENTDVAGLIGALPRPPAGSRALVLGAGGSARACAWALREGGAEVSIWNRTEERAQALATALGVAAERRAAGEAPIPPGRFDLIVNCTTVGLAEAGHPPADAPALGVLPIDADSLTTETVVVDLVYGQHPTALTRIARDRGARVVDGLEVLVHQGAASLRLWTGREPPLETMRRAARAEPQA
jgi:shikimate dehydrogenase